MRGHDWEYTNKTRWNISGSRINYQNMKKREKREGGKGGERGRGGGEINKSIAFQVTVDILIVYRTWQAKKSQECHLSEELTHTTHDETSTEECYGNHSNRPDLHGGPPYWPYCQRGKTNAVTMEPRSQSS